jgi:hypothetical protein
VSRLVFNASFIYESYEHGFSPLFSMPPPGVKGVLEGALAP